MRQGLCETRGSDWTEAIFFASRLQSAGVVGTYLVLGCRCGEAGAGRNFLAAIDKVQRNRTVEGFESGGEGQERYRRGAKVFIWRARHRLIVASTLDLAGLSRMDWCSASMCCTPVPGQSYRPSSSGVTQTVFRARKAYLPCTSTNMPVGLWRSAPRGSLSVDESSDVMDGAHPPTDAPSLARGQSGSRVRPDAPSHGAVAQPRSARGHWVKLEASLECFCQVKR
jgi:hypothetical protein